MSELWTVTLRFRGAQAPPVSLYFGGEAAARKEFEKAIALPWPDPSGATDLPVTHDHYGTSIAVFHAGALEAVILQDVAKVYEAQVEMGLKHAIAQARANTRAAGDPVLKFASGQNVGFPGAGMIRG